MKSKGEAYEGIAFTFCKAAFVALLAGPYVLIVAPVLAAVFYVMAWFHGKKDTKCWGHQPLAIAAFWLAVAAAKTWFLLR